jgi:3-hydroxyacyl-CoA dehydrogenase/enoyl-CoA hydratase/3-hydroxybutyryl-CoA epimerase/enoyl-CoA isomerase
MDTLGTANYVELAQRYAHLGALYQVPTGLRAKAERNESYYPVAAPLSDVSTGQPA